MSRTEICPKYAVRACPNKYWILKNNQHGMLKNIELLQACKDPFIYTESWYCSVRAAYARTHLQAAQHGWRNERMGHGTSCSFVALHSCMHTITHSMHAPACTRDLSNVNIANVRSILDVTNCINITNCDCVDRSFWYKVDRIDNDGMIMLNSRLLSLWVNWPNFRTAFFFFFSI